MLGLLRTFFITLCTLTLLFVFIVPAEAAYRDKQRVKTRTHFSIHVGPERQHSQYQYYRYRYQYPYARHQYHPYLPYHAFGQHWVTARHGYVPRGAVAASYHTGYPIFYCRAKYHGKMRYGVLYGRGCHLHWRGGKTTVRIYKVLVY